MDHIDIRFNKSHSKFYKQVLNDCKLFSGFTTDGKTNKLIIESKEVFQKWPVFSSLYMVVYKWKSFELIVNGAQLYGYDQHSDFLYHLASMKHCYRNEREGRVDPQEIYDSTAICCKIKSILFRLKDGNWYRHGELIGNKWVINKPLILDIIQREVRIKNLNLCYYYSEENINKKLRSLPDQIDISGPEWEKIYSTKIIDGEFIKTLVQIRWIGDDLFNPDAILNRLLSDAKDDFENI